MLLNIFQTISTFYLLTKSLLQITTNCLAFITSNYYSKWEVTFNCVTWKTWKKPAILLAWKRILERRFHSKGDDLETKTQKEVTQSMFLETTHAQKITLQHKWSAGSEFGVSNFECSPTLNDQLKNIIILRRTNLFFSVLFIKDISTLEEEWRRKQ